MPAPIPTADKWGLIIIGLLLLTAGTICVRLRARRATWCLALAIGTAGHAQVAIAAPGHVVRVPVETLRDLDSVGLAPLLNLDYGTFAWLELSDTDFASLQASGLRYEERQDALTLNLGEQRFDPLQNAPIVAPGWGGVDADGPDLHLVQFVGPTRDEWLLDLEARGLEVVQYIHPFTYIVWGEVDAVADAGTAPVVRWTGAFAPAYRVLPQWRTSGDAPQAFRLLLRRGASTAVVAQAIGNLGGQVGEAAVLDATFETVRATLSENAVRAAAQIPGVYSIQPVPTGGGVQSEMSCQVNVNNVDQTNLAFPGYFSWLAGVNLSGSGVIMANVDNGIRDSHLDLRDRMVPCVGITCGGSASANHGSHTAGIMAADGSSGYLDSFGFLRGLGVAPGASLVEQLFTCGGVECWLLPGGMLLIMAESYNNGASLSSNSWVTSHAALGYDIDTKQVDIGVRDADPNAAGNQPLTYVQVVGNGSGGTSTQGTPSEAKNIFCIGATKMRFSSGAQLPRINDLSGITAHGPALDGRTVPHMVAPGCYVDSTGSGNPHYLNCGTSMAGPQVAGGIALFIEYYRALPSTTGDPSPALIKAAFTPVAHDLAGNDDADGEVMGHPFDSKQGWGRMNLEAVVDPQVSVRYFDNPVMLDNTGQEWVTMLAPSDPAQAMRFMLVWTDAPGHGLGGSGEAWCNDLDLTVEVGANTYRGNNFGGDGWSQTGGVADFKNNTEGVFLSPPGAVTVTVRVLGSNIAWDGIPNQGDITDQDFALVCYNCSDDCNANGIPE